MAAPKPKPTVLKLLTGNAGKRAINKSEPKAVKANLKVPAHLDPIAKTQWKKLAAMLDDTGVLSETDLAALEQVCETYARIRRLRAEIRKLGGTTYTTISTSGEQVVKAYPQAAQLDSAERNYRSFVAEFGLTPSARSKVQVKEKADESDPLEKYNV